MSDQLRMILSSHGRSNQRYIEFGDDWFRPSCTKGPKSRTRLASPMAVIDMDKADDNSTALNTNIITGNWSIFGASFVDRNRTECI